MASTTAPAHRPLAKAAPPPDLPEGFSKRLYNEDLAPTPPAERTWGTYSLFAMWMSDVHSIGGYTFAAGLFFMGLAAWQVAVAMLIGIVAVYGFMLMSGTAGQATGVPFPVIGRIAFGVRGANLPALVRAIIGIAWYSIQTYLASISVQVLLLGIWPGLSGLVNTTILGLSAFGWICFLALSLFQAMVMRQGMETVRKFADLAGPIVYVAMFALAGWIVIKAGSDLSFNNLSPDKLTGGDWVLGFFTVAALVVSYFSALMLNYCDFSRFAPNKKTVKSGTLWGLPINWAVFTLLTLVVTAGTVSVFGGIIRDPVEIVAKIDSTPVVIIGALVFTTATIGINIVANYVSPAYDLANIAPEHIDFKKGGLITSGVALVIFPWEIFKSEVAVNYFLGGLGAFLGPLFGIMMVDYFRVKHQVVDQAGLYKDGPESPYWYENGWNMTAIKAFVPAAAVALVIALFHVFAKEAPFSWFIGAGLAAGIYLLLSDTKAGAPAATAPATAAH
jgi:NCS1 family nucleobase:cation symporter-1